MLTGELKTYLAEHGISHTRGKPFHPRTQGKIERYHRSLKNVINLENYYLPWMLEHKIGEFVEYYNHQRVHETLDNLTPATAGPETSPRPEPGSRSRPSAEED